MAPWLPVLQAEAIWWALVVFLIFVTFISLHNPSQAWLCGNTGDGDRFHLVGACKGLGWCLPVARIVSSVNLGRLHPLVLWMRSPGHRVVK